ncbi:MAG: hypothetical protein LC104_20780 [Bacteroidales bacterium]|nr:hypothetical protein [Bacteroidales bacterium]
MKKRLLILIPLTACLGCTSERTERHALRMLAWSPVEAPHAQQEEIPPSQFRIGVADVLEVRFATRPEWDCLASVDVTGSLPLGPAGQPRVLGLTVDAISTVIAETAQVEPRNIHVRLAEIRSARVYINGPANERSRTIGYQGSERLSHCLQRAGVLHDPAADLSRVTVMRPNVSVGGQEQIIRSDLRHIQPGQIEHDPIIHPSDVISIDETWQSRLRRLLPEWLLALIGPAQS